MNKNEWDDAIQEWLEEHDDDADDEPRRFTLQDSPTGMIVDNDLPTEVERAKARAFSLRWGWIFDLFRELWYWFTSWFTAEVMLGLFRGVYGLIMAALLCAIIYYSMIAIGRPVRILPTVDELMKPSWNEGLHEEGSPNPTDG